MVGAEVECGCVGYLLMIAYLYFGAIRPILNRRTQVDIIVHCIVVEFFLLNLIDSVSKGDIDPVEYVKHSHTRHQQVHIHISTSDDVNSQKTLQLHNILVKHCSWECRKELYNQIVGLDVCNLTFILACRNASDFQEVLNYHHRDILSVIVAKLIVVHEHKKPSSTHQLKLLIPIIHTVFMSNNFDELNNGIVVAVDIGFRHALFELPEVQGSSLEVNAVAPHSFL